MSHHPLTQPRANSSVPQTFRTVLEFAREFYRLVGLQPDSRGLTLLTGPGPSVNCRTNSPASLPQAGCLATATGSHRLLHCLFLLDLQVATSTDHPLPPSATASTRDLYQYKTIPSHHRTDSSCTHFVQLIAACPSRQLLHRPRQPGSNELNETSDVFRLIATVILWP
jgi:hypothetical protein